MPQMLAYPFTLSQPEQDTPEHHSLLTPICIATELLTIVLLT